jgi:hypothetical protein
MTRALTCRLTVATGFRDSQRICLDTLPMCHPQVTRSRHLIRHDVGNTLKYQDNHERLQTLPLNPGECGLTQQSQKMRFFAQRPKRVYSGDQIMSMSSGVPKTGERQN